MSIEDAIWHEVMERGAFRLYTPEECALGREGYPPQWDRILLEATVIGEAGNTDGRHRWGPGIKDIVREQAGNRCVRCLHPYEKGVGEWSPCDSRCQHPFKMAAGERRIVMVDGTVREELAGFDIRYRLHAPPFLVEANGATKPPGLGEIDRIEARWRILTVHHLTGSWGNEKDAKRDCRWWNLVALCQRCHLQIQGKVQMARVWPWEHSEWLKPYVAGYYASTYLKLELERPQVEERLEELLALERLA